MRKHDCCLALPINSGVDPATGLEIPIVMAVNSYSVTPLCNGVDYQLRTDIAVTLDFVTPYLD
jgi:hypothetical protein